MKLSDYVIEFLLKNKINDIFMLSGGGCIHLVDSVGKSKINYICNLHEQAAAIAADAYSQVTGNLGACLVTTGPGGTNTLTGVAAAWLDSTPIFIISGQVSTKDRINNRGVRQFGFQEIDIIPIVKTITKYAVTITDPFTIKYHLEKALYLSKAGRPGPVWIDIPLNIQACEIDKNLLADYMPEKIFFPHINAPKILKTIGQSKRPVILAGNGIRLSHALNEFKELIDKLSIPVLLTWKSMDFLDEEHRCYMGRPGAIGQRGANFVQQTADLIICIGARLDLGQTAYQHKFFAPKAKKIIVDIDPYEIDKLDMDIENKIVADAKIFLNTLLSNINTYKANHASWLARCKELQQKYPLVTDKNWEDDGFVDNYAFVETLGKYSKNMLIVLGSSGYCGEITMQALKVNNMRIFNSSGLGSMGFGISAAIGACIANNKQSTICVEGDGGFFLNMQELEVIRRLNLPIKFFILNNNGYLSIRTTQNKHFSGILVGCDPSSGVTLPSLEKTAKLFNLNYKLIKNNTELNTGVSEVLKETQPIICELNMSPTKTSAPRVSVKRNTDGSFSAAPMEDLFPFLSRDEFQRNMCVKN